MTIGFEKSEIRCNSLKMAANYANYLPTERELRLEAGRESWMTLATDHNNPSVHKGRR